jgi:hypothetical protein
VWSITLKTRVPRKHGFVRADQHNQFFFFFFVKPSTFFFGQLTRKLFAPLTVVNVNRNQHSTRDLYTLYVCDFRS